MKKTIEFISNTCTQVVTWFDGAFRTLMDMVLQLANVGIRVLIVYAIYALFVEDLLLKVLD